VLAPKMLDGVEAPVVAFRMPALEAPAGANRDDFWAWMPNRGAAPEAAAGAVGVFAALANGLGLADWPNSA